MRADVDCLWLPAPGQAAFQNTSPSPGLRGAGCKMCRNAAKAALNLSMGLTHDVQHAGQELRIVRLRRFWGLPPEP